MPSLLVAPHNDDEGLFASYIIARTHSIIAVVTDGYIHQAKFNIPFERRRNESECAAKLLDVPIIFMGVPDSDVIFSQVVLALDRLDMEVVPDFVFAPAIQHGHDHHDLVSKACTEVWGGRVIYYSTYTRDNFTPVGEIEIKPTEAEMDLKDRVLDCYTSQHGINLPHFDAVRRRPEFINFNQVPFDK